MKKRVDTSRVILGSTQERDAFCKKMQKNGWILQKSEYKIGFFLRQEFHLFFEHWIEIAEDEEYVELSIILSRDEWDLYPKREKRRLFRLKFNEMHGKIMRHLELGWQLYEKPYKKYRPKESEIRFSLHQILVRKKA